MKKQNSKLTTEQAEALKRFAAANGRYWKGELSTLWATGRDASQPDGALLRQIRNNLGPTWLYTQKEIA